MSVPKGFRPAYLFEKPGNAKQVNPHKKERLVLTRSLKG